MVDEKEKREEQNDRQEPEEIKDQEGKAVDEKKTADDEEIEVAEINTEGYLEGLYKKFKPDQDPSALQQEKEELLEKLKRKQADIDNLRRISKMEQADAREYALHKFLSNLLPVIDNLERAIESARSAENIPGGHLEGLEMIYKQLIQILEQEGVSKIEAVGCQFDPNCHHAVMQEADEESEPGIVLDELQKGYRHHSRVLRPSMVKVCSE